MSPRGDSAPTRSASQPERDSQRRHHYPVRNDASDVRSHAAPPTRSIAVGDQQAQVSGALAWQCVAWACARGGPSARAAVAPALVVPELEAMSVEDCDAPAWRALGRLTRADMREVVGAARALVEETTLHLLTTV